MRCVASFRKNGFSTKSSTGVLAENFSVMSGLVASRITAMPAVLGRLSQVFHQLVAVHAGHAIVADQQIGRIVDRFEQGVRAVAGRW